MNVFGYTLLDPWFLLALPVAALAVWRRLAVRRAALPTAAAHLFEGLPRTVRQRLAWVPLALLGLSSDFVAHGCCFHIDASPAYNARPVVHTCAQASGLTEAEQLCTRPVDGMHAMPERVGVQEDELTRCQCVLALCACRARAVGLLIPQVQRASNQWDGDEIKILVR